MKEFHELVSSLGLRPIADIDMPKAEKITDKEEKLLSYLVHLFLINEVQDGNTKPNLHSELNKSVNLRKKERIVFKEHRVKLGSITENEITWNGIKKFDSHFNEGVRASRTVVKFLSDLKLLTNLYPKVKHKEELEFYLSIIKYLDDMIGLPRKAMESGLNSLFEALDGRYSPKIREEENRNDG
jgi:hypothetical protein